MPNTIRHKRSGTASSIPAAGTLAAGELAVNTADGRVYTKRDSGAVVDVAQAILATGQTIVCAAGSAGACGVAPVGDLHTGLFFGADIVNVSTGGFQRMQIDANGNVGIGNNALSNTRLTSAFTLTNATGFGMQCNTVAAASTNGGYATFGAQVQVIHNITTGLSNTGVSRAMFVSCARNNGFSTDAGSLGFIRGMEFQYGHANTNTAISPTTTQVIGLQMVPLLGPGTITTFYDIFIGGLTHNTGTITGDHFSIFQAAATAKNYFAGRVGCNTVNPATALDVVGQITVSAGTLSLPSIVFANDANTGLFSSAADTINLVTGGVTRLTVGATGTVTTAGDHTVNGTLRATAGLQSTGARSLFRAVNEPYAVGSAYSATSGFVYFGARNESATPDAVISNAGGAALMTLQNGGNVGIGTATPGTTLAVNGTASVTGVVTVSAGTAAAPAIVPTGDTNTGRFHPAADTIAWATAGVERLRLASDGAVSVPGEFKPTAITEALIAIGGSGNAVTLSIANGTVLTITNNSTIVVPYNGPRLTITMPPPASPGKRFTLMMTVVTTGSAVLIWNTVPYSGSVKWPGNTDPTISGWAGAPSLFPFYVFDFVSDGTNWYGSASSAYLTN
jgi:hypothetical protein